jgi:hypothetical protein
MIIRSSGFKMTNVQMLHVAIGEWRHCNGLFLALPLLACWHENLSLWSSWPGSDWMSKKWSATIPVFRYETSYSSVIYERISMGLLHGGQCSYLIPIKTSKSGWTIIPEVRLFLTRWMSDFVYTNRKMTGHDSALILRLFQIFPKIYRKIFENL